MKTICEKATLLKRLVVALLLVLSADAFAYDVEGQKQTVPMTRNFADFKEYLLTLV